MRKLILSLALVLAASAQAATFDTDSEAVSQNTPEGWQAVALPKLPEITDANTFDITNYGAKTDTTDNTIAIQKAINAAISKGGGMVVIPAGTWMTGRLRLNNKTILHLSANATLKFLSMTDYTKKYNCPKGDGQNLIENNKNQSDIVIEGEDKNTSIIDAQGEDWWKAYEKDRNVKRGTCIRFSSGYRFLVRNLTIRNTPGANLTIGQSGRGADATVHDIIIRNPSSTTSSGQQSHNTDGIPVWTQRVNIYNCDISTGDDNVVVDSKGQYVHVWNCTFGDGHGCSIGSYTSEVHDILMEGITFNGTGSGFKIKSLPDRSGDVYNIVWRNSTMKNVASPIALDCWYQDKSTTPQGAAQTDTVTANTMKYHNVLIQNITSTGTPYKNSNRENFPIFIFGRPNSPIYDITFDNVQISAQKGMYLAFCKVKFINGCNISDTRTNKRVYLNYQSTIEGSYDGSETTEVKSVASGSFPARADVYSIDGRLVASNLEKADAAMLPKGIYVVEGKKFVRM